MLRRAIADHFSINLNSDLVTESFRLVHSVSSEDNRAVFQFSQQVEKRSSCNRIDTSCWFVQESELRRSQETDSATEFSFVST